MHRYSQAEKDFLKSIVAGNSYTDITEMFNSEFDMNLPVSSVMSTCFRYGYKNGRDFRFDNGYEPTQFKKGHAPVNKGTKGLMRANKTSFQKGNTPHNHRPIGSERINADGYVEIKVSEPGKWRMKHVVVWEAVNGAVPKGYVIIFADSNKQNLDMNNLIIVSRAELAAINKQRLITDNAEITKAGVKIAKIQREIAKRKRKE